MMKRLVKDLLAARARRYRVPPVLRQGRGDGRARIYYLCPDYPVPSGGIRVIYRHVDLLNAAGRESAVLHHRAGFACRWFAHATRVTSSGAVRLAPQDILVVPEIYGPFLDRFPKTIRKVVFNQNAYLTYDGVEFGRPVPYDIFEAAMVVSEDNAEYLRFAYPSLEHVSVVSNAIDPAVFYPAGQPPKRIALMPRKRPGDADQVLRLLGNRLDGWEIVQITGRSERETAEIMQSSAIFLAFGRQEGFGLPAAEAMASGCYVIGFPGLGGREIFDPAFSRPVPDDNVLEFAQAVAATISEYDRDPCIIRDAGLRAAEYIRQKYPLERQRTELLDFFTGITG